MPILGALLYKVNHVICREYNLLLEPFDVDTLLDVLSDVQVNGSGLEQVHYLLIVDL